MSTHPRPVSTRIAAVAAVATLVVGYQLLAHRITIASEAVFWSSFGAVMPMAALFFWLAWRAPRRAPMLALWLALMVALVHSWHQIQPPTQWLYFIQHLGVNVVLMLSMGLTLRRGQQPLCSRLAARARGGLTGQVAAYTRGVTAAWTLFFALMAVTSALLFWLAPIAVWSLFANLLTGPLVLLMFAGEYGIRVRVLPPEQRSGPLAAIRAYWRLQSEPQSRASIRVPSSPSGQPESLGARPPAEPSAPPRDHPRSLDPI